MTRLASGIAARLSRTPLAGLVRRPPASPVPSPRPPRGRPLAYAPELAGQAAPGEIVWTWVAYEAAPKQGKDRPVLVVGRECTKTLLGLMLSSKDTRDGQRGWFALGPGAWDADDRPSWVRLDRGLRMREDGIRREGAILDRKRFDAIAAQLRRTYGWR